MNYTTKTVRLAIIILSTTAIMIAGTYFSAMMQQQAYSSSGVRHQVKSNEEERSQHMDQENLCLRTSDCNNSNVGEQTLGNDNSVTGFADQSKNIQAQEREVIPTAPPTATPPSTCNPSTVGGITATPTDGTCTATIPFSAGPDAVSNFIGACLPSGTITRNDNTGFTCTFPSTPPT